MDAALEQRLRLCYLISLHGDVARDQIDSAPAWMFWEHVQPLLVAHGFYCPKPDHWSDGSHVIKFRVYRLAEPSGDDFTEERAEKITARWPRRLACRNSTSKR